jgi:hypothetical protein
MPKAQTSQQYHRNKEKNNNYDLSQLFFAVYSTVKNV